MVSYFWKCRQGGEGCSSYPVRQSGIVPLGRGPPERLPAPPRTEVFNTCFKRGGRISTLCTEMHRGNATRDVVGPDASAVCTTCARRALPRPPGGGAMRPGLRPGASGSSPGPCLQLSWARGEPGAEQLSRAEGARALDAGAGPGAEAEQRLLWGRDGAGRGRGPEDGSEKVAGVPGRVGEAVRAPRRWEARAVACPRSCWPSTRCAGHQFSRSSRAGPRRGVGFGSRRRGSRGFPAAC